MLAFLGLGIAVEYCGVVLVLVVVVQVGVVRLVQWASCS